MSPVPYVAPVASSESIFQPNIFKGKVLFCTGGGSGICRAMTESMVRVDFGMFTASLIAVHRCVMEQTQSLLVESE